LLTILPTRGSDLGRRVVAALLKNAAIEALLSEHSCIEIKQHRLTEFDFPEIGVSRVQEDIHRASAIADA
jgi:hypothetical protein